MKMINFRKIFVPALALSLMMTSLSVVSNPQKSYAAESTTIPLLITEIVPNSNGNAQYSFIEVYNASDKEIDLANYSIYYYYDTANIWNEKKANVWPIIKDSFSNSSIIRPQEVKVIWVKKEKSHNAPLDEFKKNYGKAADDLTEAQTLVLKNPKTDGLNKTKLRAVGIVDSKGNRVVGAIYNDGESIDVEDNESIVYSYPSSIGNTMNKMSTHEKATPGTLLPSQSSVKKETKPNPVVIPKVPSNSGSAVESTITFSDMKTHWAKSDVELLASKKIVTGVDNHNFAPDGTITRIQFLAMLVRGLGWEEGRTEQASEAPQLFKDVKSSDWFAKTAVTASKEGLISVSSDGLLKPNENINREEMAVIISKALKSVSGAASTDTGTAVTFSDQNAIRAQSAVAEVVRAGIMQGMTETEFAPEANTTRAQAVVVIKRLLQYMKVL
ncbi:S-layer homology domain-containing protein [Paenibacillus foliorum]|nr:S-layer homology domain-containing protein [Paenibacillus foliorum]